MGVASFDLESFSYLAVQTGQAKRINAKATFVRVWTGKHQTKHKSRQGVLEVDATHWILLASDLMLRAAAS